VPVEFLSDEQAEAYGTFAEEPTRPELELVEIRATAATVTIHTTAPDQHGVTLLASHSRAVGRGARVVDPAHWDGHTRTVTHRPWSRRPR
jgi:hypothetical protein